MTIKAAFTRATQVFRYRTTAVLGANDDSVMPQIWVGMAASSTSSQPVIREGNKMNTTKGRTRGAWIAALLIATATISTQIVAAPSAAASGFHLSAAHLSIQGNHAFDAGKITGHLGDTHGRAIHGAKIEIWSRASTDRAWTHLATVKTNPSGNYTIRLTPSATRVYQARFLTTGHWAGASSTSIHLQALNIATSLTSVSSSSNVAFGSGVDIHGVLTDVHNRRLVGDHVELFSLTAGAYSWKPTASTTTSLLGGYVFSPRSLTATTQFQVRFAGTSALKASAAAAIAVTVRPMLPVPPAKPTAKVGISLEHYDIISGPELVNGNVSDAQGNRVGAGQTVEVWSTAVGANAWTDLGSATTMGNGAFGYYVGILKTATSFQARYSATATLGAANSVIANATATPAPVVTPPPPVTPVPPVAAPGVPPGASPGWSSNPQLAADTLKEINVYRVSLGLSVLIPYVSSMVDPCVAQNIIGNLCDPGVLASGYTTGVSAVAAWKASPMHNGDMSTSYFVHISCAAYTNADGVSANVGCQFDL